MPTLSVVNFNIVCATLGGFITVFGLVSYLLKEKFYLSEALISTLAGLIFSPHATNFIKPLEYANFDEVNLETITLYFTRLVLGVQLVLAGVQLPSKYLKTEWKSLSILLGPGMCAMWISTSLLVWALVPNINILFALSVGACVTPTDPVLSNSIVKGKFADKNIPPDLQKIIIAESGANDGLGYPFLFLGLYLIKYTGDHGLGVEGGADHAMRLWFGETWGYTILLSVVYGFAVGWVAKELLHWAEGRRYVDRESFLVFAITLAVSTFVSPKKILGLTRTYKLFIVGTVGMIGSDDVLACFIAGNAFTWDDWFRLETKDDSLQPTIDMLLNVAVFMWFGAVCPWHMFVANDVIPIYRLIPLGILVLLFRRLPMVLAFHTKIREINHMKEALFVGFFGPIGVSAIFYLYVSREFLRDIEVDGQEREDADRLAEVMNVVVWFLAICSIVVHGLSIPVGKLGFHLPRTISTAISTEALSRTSSMSQRETRDPVATTGEMSLTRSFRRRRPTSSEQGPRVPDANGEDSIGTQFMKLFPGLAQLRHGWRASHGKKPSEAERASGVHSDGTHPEISGPKDARLIGQPIQSIVDRGPVDDASGRKEGELSSGEDSPEDLVISDSPRQSRAQSPASTRERTLQRSIRFPDETPVRREVKNPDPPRSRDVSQTAREPNTIEE